MTLQITLGPEEEARLRERAEAAGVDVLTFARDAVMEKIDRPNFAERLAPFHEATRRAGLSEDDVGAMVERARNERWEEHERPDRPLPPQPGTRLARASSSTVTCCCKPS